MTDEPTVGELAVSLDDLRDYVVTLRDDVNRLERSVRTLRRVVLELAAAAGMRLDPIELPKP